MSFYNFWCYFLVNGALVKWDLTTFWEYFCQAGGSFSKLTYCCSHSEVGEREQEFF